MRFVVTYEDNDDKEEVYVLMYKNLEGNVIKGSGYIAYMPETKIFGLETYYVQNHPEWFTHKYKSDTVGKNYLGIVSNHIELDDYMCEKLSMISSVAKSYKEFLESFSSEEELFKTFDKVIVDHQL